MPEQRDSDQTWHEFLYWGLGLAGLVALKQLWTSRISPWIETMWGDAAAGSGVAVPLVGSLDRADIVGIGALVLVLGVAIAVLLRRVSRRRWGDHSTRAGRGTIEGGRMHAARGRGHGPR